MILIPILASQLADFIGSLPRLSDQAAGADHQLRSAMAGKDASASMPASLREGLNSLLDRGRRLLDDGLRSRSGSSGVALFNIAGLFVVTPGRRLLHAARLGPHGRQGRQLGAARPRRRRSARSPPTSTPRRPASCAGRARSAWCSASYAVGLTLTGLNFGILIGLFAGLISFIPYVGSLVGLVLAVGVAFVQFWPDWIS